ncbi:MULTISPECIES: DUF4984 domain-containing protein [unclassified Carboxylicivirga]|uniref:DUF4984 domain-containing protein n=1 Tax=Carboxylicivirga TaxID=1628153 RepID=UPI003D33FD7F
MKQIVAVFAFIATLIIALPSCDGTADRVTYDGPEYVMFSDTLTYFPVSDSETYLHVPIASTVASDRDRTYAVEIDDENSSAVEGIHYELASNSVTIKAGERAADLKIRGLVENISEDDELSISFKLIVEDAVRWEEYGTRTRVQMLKSCPFDMAAFTGYCKVTSTFFREYMGNTDFRLVHSDMLNVEDNSIVIRDFFYKGYDIEISLDSSNPLEPFVSMAPQVLGSTAEAFGTIHGNGKLMVAPIPSYISYYNVCQRFVVQYAAVYVDDVGTVGNYVNVIEWISDEEAERLKKQGY